MRVLPESLFGVELETDRPNTGIDGNCRISKDFEYLYLFLATHQIDVWDGI